MPSKTRLFLLDCPPKLYLWQLTGTYWSSGCWFTWIPAFRLYLLSFVAIYIFLWIWYACFNVMTLSCKCIHTGVGRVDDNLHKPLKFYCFCPKSAFNTRFCCYSRSFICTSETRFFLWFVIFFICLEISWAHFLVACCYCPVMVAAPGAGLVACCFSVDEYCWTTLTVWKYTGHSENTCRMNAGNTQDAPGVAAWSVNTGGLICWSLAEDWESSSHRQTDWEG